MYTTARLIVTAAAVVVLVGTTACSGENPAASAGTNARFDSGVTFGGGGRAGESSGKNDSGGTFGSGGLGNPALNQIQSQPDSANARDGGGTFGSGG